MKYFKTLFPATIFLVVIFGCEVADPVIENDEELITTLYVDLVPASGGPSVRMEFQDLDGDGGDPPIVTGATLQAATQYNMALELLNASVVPVEDITEEILDEAEEHQFFFIADNVDLVVSYLDSDANGFPVGVESVLQTGNPGQGTFTVVLRHLPDKTAIGVSSGMIDNAGGGTDLEVVFDVIIE